MAEIRQPYLEPIHEVAKKLGAPDMWHTGYAATHPEVRGPYQFFTSSSYAHPDTFTAVFDLPERDSLVPLILVELTVAEGLLQGKASLVPGEDSLDYGLDDESDLDPPHTFLVWSQEDSPEALQLFADTLEQQLSRANFRRLWDVLTDLANWPEIKE